jgi:hypothetical protein
VAVGLIGSAAVLSAVAFAATWDWGHGATSLRRLGTETTETTVTTTAKITAAMSIPPIEVKFEFGTAIIAEHMVCNREDDLTGESIEAVRAAVAADNDNPADPGGAPKPYAHDARAQSEIVRASMQELHEEKRFYADCEPVPATATVTPDSEGSPVAATSTLPRSD